MPNQAFLVRQICLTSAYYFAISKSWTNYPWMLNCHIHCIVNSKSKPCFFSRIDTSIHAFSVNLKNIFVFVRMYTAPQKHESTSLQRMYWTNFWQLTFHVQQKKFEKTLIKVESSHLCASFGIFCVQIGKLL